MSTEDKICKNCEFWQPFGIQQKFGGCSNNKILYDRQGHGYTEYKDLTGDELVYCDSEEYNADCTVGQNFGCIHFRRNK